eukprot:2701514-Amphidinium_carterae.1
MYDHNVKVLKERDIWITCSTKSKQGMLQKSGAQQMWVSTTRGLIANRSVSRPWHAWAKARNALNTVRGCSCAGMLHQTKLPDGTMDEGILPQVRGLTHPTKITIAVPAAHCCQIRRHAGSHVTFAVLRKLDVGGCVVNLE